MTDWDIPAQPLPLVHLAEIDSARSLHSSMRHCGEMSRSIGITVRGAMPFTLLPHKWQSK